MSGFLYFVPGKKHVDDKVLEEAGIKAIGKAEGLSFIGIERGPEGESGILFLAGPVSSDRKAPRIGYYPAQQTWQSCNHGKFWLGYETSHRPEPADLVREEMIAGHQVTLADGHDWMVPLARVFPKGTALPQALVLGPDGELVTESLPQFAKLSQDAERVFEWHIGEDVTMNLQEAWDAAIRALAQNYRLDKWEVSMLRLLTDANVTETLLALIDGPEIKAFINSKKKDEDTDSLSDGDRV